MPWARGMSRQVTSDNDNVLLLCIRTFKNLYYLYPCHFDAEVMTLTVQCPKIQSISCAATWEYLMALKLGATFDIGRSHTSFGREIPALALKLAAMAANDTHVSKLKITLQNVTPNALSGISWPIAYSIF